MRLHPRWCLSLLLACGGGDGASGSATTSAGDTSTGAPPTTSDPTMSPGSSTGEASTATTATTDTTTAGAAGPIVLFHGAPGDAVVPDWDPDNPRPLLAAQFGFGDAWAGSTLIIHPDGTVTSNANLIVIWGFEPLTLLYDGVHFGGSLPAWDPVAPAAVLAMGTGMTLAGDWMTMTPGLWVDTNSGFIAPGSVVDRIAVWSFDAAIAPPSALYIGPWDGSYVVPAWDPDQPAPMIVWNDTVIAGQWRQVPLAVFADGTTNTDPTNIRVFGW
jgi:hypothetical protein